MCNDDRFSVLAVIEGANQNSLKEKISHGLNEYFAYN